MFYIPSPIKIPFDLAYQAKANKSGRMQYYRIKPGNTRERIARADFIEAYNNSNIIAMRPLPAQHGEQVFQIEFFISLNS